MLVSVDFDEIAFDIPEAQYFWYHLVTIENYDRFIGYLNRYGRLRKYTLFDVTSYEPKIKVKFYIARMDS